MSARGDRSKDVPEVDLRNALPKSLVEIDCFQVCVGVRLCMRRVHPSKAYV